MGGKLGGKAGLANDKVSWLEADWRAGFHRNAELQLGFGCHTLTRPPAPE